MGGLTQILQVTFILLLVVKTSLNCRNFEQLTITSEYADNISVLRRNLPLDYSSETITNLKEDSLCSNIWNSYFYERELKRLYDVSGDDLKTSVNNVHRHLNFTKECTFDVSKHCKMERKTNISDFLGNVLSTMEKMKDNLPIDLSNCSEIQCDTDTPPISLPDKDNQESDKSQEASRQHWVLIFILVVMISIAAICYCIKNLRRTGQRRDDVERLDGVEVTSLLCDCGDTGLNPGKSTSPPKEQPINEPREQQNNENLPLAGPHPAEPAVEES